MLFLINNTAIITDHYCKIMTKQSDFIHGLV